MHAADQLFKFCLRVQATAASTEFGNKNVHQPIEYHQQTVTNG